MKKRLIPALLLIVAILLATAAPAETNLTHTHDELTTIEEAISVPAAEETTDDTAKEPEQEPDPACPGCGKEGKDHKACETCGEYSCVSGHYFKKHGSKCKGCGEKFCGGFFQKGHGSVCGCGAYSCDDDYKASEHARCDCGTYICRDPLFEINHKACEACGLKLCNTYVYGRVAHGKCSACGMHKCDPDYNETDHHLCRGCEEPLCATQDTDHTSCSTCHRYVCNPKHNYYKEIHEKDIYGRWQCLRYPPEKDEKDDGEIGGNDSAPEVEPTPVTSPEPESKHPCGIHDSSATGVHSEMTCCADGCTVSDYACAIDNGTSTKMYRCINYNCWHYYCASHSNTDNTSYCIHCSG